jgi:ferritin-like metal-binding protein YciE
MPTDDIQEQIVKYLTDLHSTEEHAIASLKVGAAEVKDEELAHVLGQHLVETREHERLVRERLQALGHSPSALKDTMSKGLAAVTGAVSTAAADTTGKIAIQAYAMEHLEIASYRMLHAVAYTAQDTETAELAERILQEEAAAAVKLDILIEQAAMVGLPQTATAI